MSLSVAVDAAADRHQKLKRSNARILVSDDGQTNLTRGIKIGCFAGRLGLSQVRTTPKVYLLVEWKWFRGARKSY